MLRHFIFVWPCLLFVSCDKQGSSDSHKDEPTDTTTKTHRPLSAREDTPEASKQLRQLLANSDTLDPAERDKALAAFAWDAIETDQEVAHQAFKKMSPDSPEKIRLIQHCAMRLAAQNPDQAIEWAKALESAKEISSALSQIAVSLAETDPQRAANLLVDSELPGRDFEVAIVQVIQRWAAQSAPDAAEWVVMFPQSAAREAGIKVIAERWLPQDTPTAFAWLDKMTDKEVRKETARAMEGIILQQTPETRDAWLLHANPQIRIELEQQREQALKDVGNNIPQPGD